MRTVLFGLGVLFSLGVVAAADRPSIAVAEIASPTAGHAVGPALTVDAQGKVWLSWVEPSASAPEPAASAPHEHHHGGAVSSVANTLRYATLDRAKLAWTAPRTIATEPSVTTNWADFPQLAAAGNGDLFAVWADGHGGARVSTSRDAGQTWSAPAAWTRAGIEVEKFSLARLADGTVRAVWLDGRERKGERDAQRLYTRIVGGEDAADRRLDDSVCDCCQTTIVPFLDGSALVGYRDRSKAEIRDISVLRVGADRAGEPQPINRDGWHIAGCPVNGPRLATDGSRVAAAWFTGADNDPRVLVSFSPDAGVRWLAPLRVDNGHAAGHVDTVLLRDGAILVTWLETDGSLWLRRIAPDFSTMDPIALAPAGHAVVRSVPRMALIDDYAGGRSAAKVLVAYTRDGDGAGVQTLTVDVPEGDFLIVERNCDCAPTPEQLQGFALRGTVVSADATASAVRVRHEEVPGVFAAGTHDFRIGGLDLVALREGQDFLGRIERRDGRWTLYDVRLLAAPVR